MITGIVGTGCLVAYLRDVVHVFWLWRRGIRTSGVVVDNAETRAESGTRWAPIIAFEDQHGNRVACKPIVRMDKMMQLGQEVPVVHLAHKPEVMLIFTRWSMVRSLLENWILLLLGSGFLGFAVAGVFA
ncbi:DUF3592 domain-containing protein [Actinomadura viridis]|uniref:DUF3592 domain-containing protein n=1 Tax=Actinomadura viridis TaxID=58110 RepID=A0A931DFZ5_9ACTN|nr:DUF3592 domain-containing protein [Actinomadura viridis]MBG6086048.1 hypothetical protein [Actinomadura viridis]